MTATAATGVGAPRWELTGPDTSGSIGAVCAGAGRSGVVAGAGGPANGSGTTSSGDSPSINGGECKGAGREGAGRGGPGRDGRDGGGGGPGRDGRDGGGAAGTGGAGTGIESARLFRNSASSKMSATGRQSSSPSCHARESLVMVPARIFVVICSRVNGPEGSPLIPTNHSSRTLGAWAEAGPMSKRLILIASTMASLTSPMRVGELSPIEQGGGAD